MTSVQNQTETKETSNSAQSEQARSTRGSQRTTVQLKGKSYEQQEQALSPSAGGFAAQEAAVRPQSAAVQAKGSDLQKKDVHDIAAQGTQGSGSALPYLNIIQGSFGSHDVSNVQAYSGGAAQGATQALGAQAYASGNKVAFNGSTSLHTAAHEAAHIVQQRSGVSLSGGVGQSGDSYEQHADAVADAVVQGKSAEGLLNRFAGGSPGAAHGAATQLKEADPSCTYNSIDFDKEEMDDYSEAMEMPTPAPSTAEKVERLLEDFSQRATALKVKKADGTFVSFRPVYIMARGRGKLTPKEIQDKTQAEVNKGDRGDRRLISNLTPRGIRAWLRAEQIGMDCSGLVSHATADLIDELGLPNGLPNEGHRRRCGSGKLTGHFADGKKRGFRIVPSGRENLRPGDVMHLDNLVPREFLGPDGEVVRTRPGTDHVRQVVSVNHEHESGTQFTTIESSGSADGPVKVTWLWPDGGNERTITREGRTESDTHYNVTFSRLKGLAKRYSDEERRREPSAGE
jgi:hypothetical protein